MLWGRCSNGYTFDGFIECSVDGDVGDYEEFKLALAVFLVEELLGPLGLSGVTNSATDFVAKRK